MGNWSSIFQRIQSRVSCLSHKLVAWHDSRRVNRPWLGYVEPLEQRIYLNGQLPNHVLAEFNSAVDDANGADPVAISVLAEPFTPNRLGTVGLGFHVKAEDGSELDPAAVEIRDNAGNKIKSRFANPDLPNSQSLVLAELEPGRYEVSTRGEHSTLGPYRLEVFLVGDADGSGSVDRSDDTQIMREAFGSEVGDPAYRVEADANLDGQISSFDMAHHIRNIQAQTQVEIGTSQPQPPVLHPIEDQTIDEGDELTVTANASDADTPAAELIFSLETGAPDVAAIDLQTGLFTWTPKEAQGPGDHSVTVRVTDSDGLTDTVTFLITVNEVNVPPVLDPIGDQTVDEGQELAFIAAATDPDIPANTLTFSLDSGAPDGATIDSVTGVLTWTPGEADGPGTFEVTVRVTDSGTPALDDSETITVTVNAVNEAPVLDPIDDQTISVRQPLTVTATASDPDLPANDLTFGLGSGAPDGITIDPISGVITWTPTSSQEGDHPVTVRVTDEGGLSDTTSFMVVVGAAVPLPPVLAPADDQAVDEGQQLALTVSASDPDTPLDDLVFTLEPGAPDGLGFDSVTPGVPGSARIIWTPTETQGPGDHSVTVRVTDPDGLFDTQTITITVSEVNEPPVLDPIGDQTVDEGQELAFTATATDPDIPANTLTFGLDSGAPDGASIDPVTGVISWMPGEVDGPGTFEVTVRVTDTGTSVMDDSETITVTVNEVNEAPVLDLISDQTLVVDQELTIDADASDADLPANDLTFGLEQGSPDGMAIDSVTGMITWKPTTDQEGDHSVTVRVTDEDGLSDTTSFMVTVSAVVALPPVLAPADNQVVDEGQELAFTANASDPDTPLDDLVFSLEPGVPDGLGFDLTIPSVPGSAKITWIPTEQQGPGGYSVTVRVTDSDGLFDTQTIMITVNEVNLPPVVDTIANQSTLPTLPLSITVSATDPDLPPNNLVFSLDPGAPTGASIDPTSGQFDWQAGTDQLGTHPITVRVTDDAGLFDTTSFTVTVGTGADNDPPEISANLFNDTAPDPIACLFDHDLTDWTATESGGSVADLGGVTPINCHAVLREGDSFLVTLKQTFEVSDQPSVLAFSYTDLFFDTTDDFINDAFEVALVDSSGASLVHAIGDGRDAFFNVTEGLPPLLGSGVTLENQTVSVDISQLFAGTNATLIFRLVNSDQDTETSVRITSVRGPPGPGATRGLSTSTALAGEPTDGVTADASIAGTVTDDGVVISLLAGFNDTPTAEFVEVLDTANFDPDSGSFFLERTDLDFILGGPLPDGSHTLHLIAKDDQGVDSDLFDIAFTLDTQAPTVSVTAFDTATGTLDVVFSEPPADSAFEPSTYLFELLDGSDTAQLIPVDTVEQVDATTARIHVSEPLPGGAFRLTVAEGVGDVAGNRVDDADPFEFVLEPPVTISSVSPFNGEEMVSLARDVVVRFDGAIDLLTVNDESFYLIANGVRVPGSIRVSATKQFTTFFRDDPLPASTEVRVVVMGDLITSVDGRPVDADGDGIPGGTGIADFRTVPMARIPGTNVSGRVIASERDQQGNDVPLEGVTIRVDGIPDLFAVTDANGQFMLVDVPAPEFFVHVDGSTVTAVGGGPLPDQGGDGKPDGFYPIVGKVFHSVPGQSIELTMDGDPFDIHLPFILNEAMHDIVPDGDTTVGLPPSQVGSDPDLAQVKLTVFDGTLINNDRTPGSEVGIFRVDSDRLPAPLPDGLDHSFDITVQADASNFDEPAQITFPNVDGLSPGEKSLLMSFDHAQGEWVVVGTLTVSDDGATLVSDPGVGIRAPGWHGVQQGAVVRGGLVLGTRGGLLGRSGIDEPAFQTGLHYWAIENLDTGFVIRGVSTVVDRLIDQRVLAPNTPHRLSVLGLLSLQQGEVEFATPGNGSSLTLPTVQLERVFLDDSDGDGLNNRAEFIVGTGVGIPDTDGDGVKDLAELRQGLDPLDGVAFPTGVIASLPLEGVAREVVLEGSPLNPELLTAYLATGSHGLAIVDVSRFNFPIVLGQLELPGTTTDIAVDIERAVAVLTAGADGVHLVDVSDPMQPVLITSVPVTVANQVEITDGLAYVAVGNRLHSYDLFTGELIDDIDVGGATITGLAREGLMLYTMDSSRVLRAIDISDPVPALLGNQQLDDGAGKLFVGNGIAYAAAINSTGRGGFATADVSDPTDIIALSGSDVPGFLFAPGRDVAVNGSDLALVVGLLGGATPALDVLDISDPENTNEFMLRIPLPAEPFAVSIANGISFVADGTAGLQVVNYLSFDANGQAPQVTITTPSATDEDDQTDGIQVTVGSLVPIIAAVTDDVQVRNVQLLVDGQVVANAASFPFDLSVVAAGSTLDADTMTLSVRATDTGGNIADSDPLVLNLVPDTTAPVIVSQTPFDGAFRGKSFRTVRVLFNEPMDVSALTSENIFLTAASDPTQPLVPSDIQVRVRDRLVQLTYDQLAPNEYQLTLNRANITDRAGNALGTGQITSNFSIVDSDAVWISAGGGFWDDSTNWETGSLPGSDDDVFVSTLGGVPVVHRMGTTNIHSLTARNELVLSGDSVLDVVTNVQVDSGMTINGATLKNAMVLPGVKGKGIVISANSGNRLDGVTLDGDVIMTDAGSRVRIVNGLTLNGQLTLGNGSFVAFDGDQTLSGDGELVFSGEGNTTSVFIEQDSVLTVGPELTLRGGKANIGGAVFNGGDESLINQGRIEADLDGLTLTIQSDHFTNEGVLAAKNGGTLHLATNWATGGVLEASSGGVLLHTSTLTNTDQVLDLTNIADDGLFRIEGGTIVGGTITGVEHLQLASNNNNRLDGVTLEGGNLSLTNSGARARIRDGLTVNSTVTLGNGAFLAFDNTQTLGGDGELVFSGEGNTTSVFIEQDSVLTVGPELTLRGGKANIGGAVFNGGMETLINQGRIEADLDGLTLTIQSDHFTNEGVLAAKNGGTLHLATNWATGGVLEASSGGVLLHTSVLTNTDQVLDLTNIADDGLFRIEGGTIVGGTITGVEHLQLASNNNNRLDGVTLEGGNLSLTNSGARARIRDGLTVNSTVTLGNGAFLAFDNTQTLGGDGELVFSGEGNTTSVFIEQDSVLTVGPELTLRGGKANIGGAVFNGGMETLINQGRIEADLDGLTLTIQSDVFTNEGVLAASNGGTLRTATAWDQSGGLEASGGGVLLHTSVLTNTDQVLDLTNIADDGLFRIEGGTIVGGTITGVEHLQLASNNNNRLTGVTLEGGNLSLTNSGARARIRDGLTVNSTVTLGNSAFLAFDNTQTLGGDGELMFSGEGNGATLFIEQDSVLTVSPELSLRGGKANIGGAAFNSGTDTLINHGRIEADLDGLTLTIRSDVFTNEGVLAASNGGTLRTATAWDQSGGLEASGGGVLLHTSVLTNTDQVLDLTNIADDGLFRIEGGTIVGGTIAGVEHLQLASNNNNRLTGVTLEGGNLSLTNSGARARIRDGLTVNSTVTLDNSAFLAFDNTQTLGGDGELMFSGEGNGATLFIEQDSVLTVSPELSLRGGKANIGGAAFNSGTDTLINHGRIEADLDGLTLTIRSDVFTNEGVLAASNGGTLRTATAWDQSGGLEASGGGVLLHTSVLTNTDQVLDLTNIADDGLFRIEGGTIVGGTIAGVEHLQLASNNNNRLTGVTLEGGNLSLTNSGARARIRDGLTVNSTVTLGNSAFLAFDNTQTLGGDGELMFSGEGNGATLFIEQDSVLTVSPELSLRGGKANIGGAAFNSGTDTLINHGRIEADLDGLTLTIRSDVFTNEGVLAATNGGTLQVNNLGQNSGTIEAGASSTVTINGNLTQELDSTIEVAVDGALANQLGRVNVTGGATLAGTLRVTTVDGFVPALGQSFQVMTFDSRSGEFDNLIGPGAVGDPIFGVIYNDTKITVTVESFVTTSTAIFESDDLESNGPTNDTSLDAEVVVSGTDTTETDTSVNDSVPFIDVIDSQTIEAGPIVVDVIEIPDPSKAPVVQEYEQGSSDTDLPVENSEQTDVSVQVVEGPKSSDTIDSEPADLISNTTQPADTVASSPENEISADPADSNADTTIDSDHDATVSPVTGLGRGQRAPPQADASVHQTLVQSNGVHTQAPAAVNSTSTTFPLAAVTSDANLVTTVGTEFWLTFPTSVGLVGDQAQLSLLITSQTGTTGTVQIPGLAFVAPFSVTAGHVTTVSLPLDADLGPVSDQVADKGIHVIALDPVTVYGLSRAPESSDAFLGLPVQLLGTEHMVLSYKNLDQTLNVFETFPGTAFALVATEDNTAVSITPSVTTGTHEAGVPFVVTLNAGQTYQLRHFGLEPADLTGTTIVSTKPIAVFGSHAAANIPAPAVAYADYLVEQLPPTSAWGTQFVTVPLATRQGGDTFRFLADTDTTTITIDGVVVATIDRGQFHELVLTDPAHITANNPVLVAQFAHSTDADGVTGDPFMALVPPVSHYLDQYTVTTDVPGGLVRAINLVVPAAAIGQITLDGDVIAADSFVVLGTSGFATAQILVDPGSHTLHGPQPFGVSVYGFGTDEGYGYPAGLAVPLPPVDVASLTVSPGTADLPVGDTHTVTALVVDSDGLPIADLRVDFTVSGANTASGFGVTDGDGITAFSYQGAQPGTDTVTAAIVERAVTDPAKASATASATWSVLPLMISILSPQDGTTVPVDETVLVSGQASSPDGVVTYVTVNGTPVATHDSAGNFFTTVTVASGINLFEFIAHDSFGQTATAELTLAGAAQDEIDNQRLSSTATASLEGVYGRTSFNDGTSLLFADLAVRNDGTFAVDIPLWVGIDQISDPSVRVRNFDGVTGPDSVPYYDFSDLVAGGVLEPGQQSGQRSLVFFNPNRVRFTYELVFITKVNGPPVITSVPDPEAVVDQPYSYDVEAIDPDGDVLTFSLLVAPAAMTIDPDSGQLTWTPGTADVGTHEILLRVEDDHGNGASQQFTLTVIEPVGNRPPVITSVPVTETTVSPSVAGDPQIIDLGTWSVVELANTRDPSPVWVLDDDNTSVTQTLNAEASVFLGDFELSNSRIEGTFRVNTTVDDDLIGFVFGYQDSQHFYLFDWKQGTQNVPGLLQLQGMTVRRIDAPTPLDNREDLAQTFGNGDRSVTLFHNSVAWNSFVDYQWILEFHPGQFTITVKQGQSIVESITIADDRYSNGLFGFYNRSQGGVNYKGFTREAIRQITYQYDVEAFDPDGDDLTYTLTAAPEGMQIVAQTGLISWSPTPDQVGLHSVEVTVSDGRGGVATQAFVIDVGSEPGNHAPIVVSTPVTRVTVGGLYEYDVNALDTDGDTLVYELDATSPVGMAIDPATGVVMWQTAADDLGRHEVTVVVDDGRGGLATHVFNVDVVPVDANRDPQITSTPPAAARVGQTFGYLVTATDPDGDDLTFGLLEAPTGMTIDPVSGLITWTPADGQQGSQTIEVQVADRPEADPNRAVDTQSFTVHVADPQPNEPPVITSTPLFDAVADRLYAYQVIAADPNGDFVTFELTESPAGMAIDEQSGQITWTPVEGQPDLEPVEDANFDVLGAANVTVTANDGRGGSDTQAFQILVRLADNLPPRIDSIPPDEAVFGVLYRYDVIATDPDGDELTFDLLASTSVPLPGIANALTVPASMTIDPETGVLVWVPAVEEVGLDTSGGFGVQELTIRVRDGNGGFDLQQVAITVRLPNTVPVITSIPPQPAVVDIPYRYTVRVQDAENDPLTFALDTAPEGMTIDPDTGVINWTPDQIGTHTVSLIVSDDRGGVATQTFVLPVVVTAPNDPPAITSSPRTTTGLGQSYFYAVLASDPNGDVLSYSLDTAPAGMTIDSDTGLLTWAPDTSTQLGPHTVSIQVDDGRGASDTQDYTLTVVADATNSPPQIVSVPGLVAFLGEVYTYDAEAIDPDGDTVVWHLAESPVGMSIDPLTGSVLWTPTQAGAFNVVVQAIDPFNGVGQQSYVLTVAATNTPPLIFSVPVTEAAVTTAYTYAVGASDPDGDVLTFTLVESPQGMAIDTNTGVVTWTADQLGVHNVVVQAEDGRGGLVEQGYTLLVTDGVDQNAPPNITSTPSFVGTVGVPYQYQIEAVDPEGGALLYQLLDAPAGMAIDQDTGLVTWTPGQVGAHGVEVAVSDPLGAGGAQQYTITVRVSNAAPIITSNPVQTAVAGAPYAYDVFATDPDGDPLGYELTEAPAGMTIDNLGRIRWTPGVLGLHDVTVTVTDDRGLSATQAYTVLVVDADTEPPSVSVTVSHNPVHVGGLVTFTVTATDNVAVALLTFELDGTPLQLNDQGGVTLTAGQVGEFDYIATATDTSGNTGTVTGVLTVFNPQDNTAPFVQITSPDDGATVSTFTDIVGTVTDAQLQEYTLSIAPAAGGDFTVIATGTTNVVDDVLGTFDPTLLVNDSYILRLAATDLSGNRSTVQQLIHVTGELKIGNFTLSFVDLSIPVSGIPIVIGRTYDTLMAHQSDDLGFGWRLDIKSTDLRTSVPNTGLEEDSFITAFNAFKEGDKVFVTLPGGKRESFTFKPVGRSFTFGLPNRGLFDLIFWQPRFEPDDDTTSTLTVQNHTLFSAGNEQGTELFGFQLGGKPYNPADPEFGGTYTLTTREGVQFIIDGLTGDLRQVSERNGNMLTYTDDGVFSSTGVAVLFERDPQGRITAVVDPMGNKIHYGYDTNGDLVTVTDREGNVTQFVYDEQGRFHFLNEVIDPLGRTGARSEYDENGRLETLVDVNGNEVQLVHDPENSVETIVDALGNESVFIYDERGNVLTEINGEGNVTQRAYDINNNMLTETVVLDNGTELTTTFTYNSRGDQLTVTDPLGHTTVNTYDASGNLLTTTDPLGNTTTNTYDGSGNLSSTTDALGNTTEFAYDSAGNLLATTDSVGNMTTFTYDSRGNLTSTTDPADFTTTFMYDGNGNQTSSSYTWVNPDDPTDTHVVTTQTIYDAAGRVTGTIDADGNEIQTTYDAVGNAIQTTDTLGNVTVSVYDNRSQPIETQFPNGTLTRSVYDELGRVIYAVDRYHPTLPHGPPNGTRTIFDKAGRVIETQRLNAVVIDIVTLDDGSQASVFVSAGPIISKTSSVYDAAGRVIESTNEDNQTTKFEYDAAGRQTAVIDALNHRTEFEFNTAGQQTLVRDALERETSFEYDALGRQVKTIFHDGTFTETHFDELGRRIAETDQTGKTRNFEYDALGRLIAVELPAVADPENGGVLTRPRYEYEYDIYGNQRLIRDPKGRETLFTFDQQNRQIARTLPNGEAEHIEYDSLGRVFRQINFKGQVTQFVYDDLGRQVEKRLGASVVDADAGIFEVVITTSYDELGRQETINDPRHGLTTFTYDDDSQITQIASPEGVINYQYDPATDRQTRVFTDFTDVRYTYDELGRLQTVATHKVNGVELASPEITTYTYTAVGTRESVSLPNGVVTNYVYDDLDRLTNVTTEDASGGLLTSYTYTLAADGRRLGAVELQRELDGTLSERQLTWTYDGLNRLVKEESVDVSGGRPEVNYTTDYVYDLVGNRLEMVTVNAEGTRTVDYQYNDADQLLTETTTTTPSPSQGEGGGEGQTTVTTYDYDANGSLIEKRVDDQVVAQYTYNLENRLETATTFSTNDQDQEVVTVTSYLYDQSGIRVRATTVVTVDGVQVSSTVQVFLIDLLNATGFAQVFETQDAAGNPDVTYIIGDDVIAQVTAGGDARYLGYDGHGSTRFLTDTPGDVVDRYDYDAYGNALNFDASQAVTVLLYTGEQFDGNIRQYYLRARYYNAANGRFNRLDPFAGNNFDPQSLHKYAYVHGDSINGTDPSGTIISLTGVLQSVAIRGYLAALSVPPAIKFFGKAVTIAISLIFPEIFEWIPPGNPGPFDELGQISRGVNNAVRSGLVKTQTISSFRAIPNYRFEGAGSFLWPFKTPHEVGKARFNADFSPVVYSSSTIRTVKAERRRYFENNSWLTFKSFLQRFELARIWTTGRTLDLTKSSVRQKIGVTLEMLKDAALGGNQVTIAIGEAAKKAGVDALIVPSVTGAGNNIVILDDLAIKLVKPLGRLN